MKAEKNDATLCLFKAMKKREKQQVNVSLNEQH